MSSALSYSLFTLLFYYLSLLDIFLVIIIIIIDLYEYSNKEVVDVGLSRMLNTDQSKKLLLSLAVLRIQIKDV